MGRRGPAVNAPPPEFEERVVQIDRVARVVKGGRRFRFRATVVVGDRKTRVGLGIAKGSEVQGAIQKAIAEAKKDLITVKTVGDSIPFGLVSQFAGAKLMLKPARPGTGIIAGGAVRPIVELSGITNILSKSLGSNNRINNAKAAMLALKEIAATDISRLTPAVAPPAASAKKPAAAEADPDASKSKPAKPAKKTAARKIPAAESPAKNPADKKAS
jgi:small subunit ribosomal protein S5